MRFKGIFSRFLRCETAQSLLEFALVFPLLLVMLAIIFDFGRVVDAKFLIQSATSEGIQQLSATEGTISETEINADMLYIVNNEYDDRLDLSKLTICSSVDGPIEKDYFYHVKSGNSWNEVASNITYSNATVNLTYEVPIFFPITKLMLGEVFSVSSTSTAQVILAGYQAPPGSLQVKKVFVRKGQTTPTSVDITITGPTYPSGNTKTFTDSDNTQIWTDLQPGSYNVTEASLPSGWRVQYNPGQTVTVSSGSAKTVTVTNTYR
jgi:Flp pilus assembly protein TadG